MSLVLVERSFARPIAFGDIRPSPDRAGCLEAHGVRFLKSYFSRDRRRMICFYEAPDAESVRLAQEKAGMPFERAWASRAVRYAAPEPDGDTVVVERTLPEPMDEDAVREATARGAWCREAFGCRIAWTYLSSDGRRAVCVYAGPDAESVRQVQRQTGMPFDGVWPATTHEPSPASA